VASGALNDGLASHGVSQTVPKTNTIAIPLPINKLTDLLRLELAMCGYTEALTLSLVCCASADLTMSHIQRGAGSPLDQISVATSLPQCSLDEAFKWLRMENPGNVAVTIANPATMEFQVCNRFSCSGCCLWAFCLMLAAIFRADVPHQPHPGASQDHRLKQEDAPAHEGAVVRLVVPRDAESLFCSLCTRFIRSSSRSRTLY
jgi:hypothetical protein